MKKIFFICLLFACNLLFAVDFPKGDIRLNVGDSIGTPFDIGTSDDYLNFIKGRITSILPYDNERLYIVKIYDTAERIEYELCLRWGDRLYTRDYFVYLGYLEPYDSRSRDEYEPYYIRVGRLGYNEITINYVIADNLEKD